MSYNRAALDITNFVAGDGPDFGDAAITQFLAEGYRGQIPVDFTVPNRVITIPLLLRDTTGRPFNQIREFIQAKAALFQREGGWFKRQLTDGVVYADVVSATLHFGGSRWQAMRDLDPDAVLTLECIPDFYGDEIALGLHAETTLPELVFTESGVKGDFPARVRLVVDEDQGVNQHGLLWGMRSRHYSPDSTARLAYRAISLTPLDAASASSGVAVTHGSVGKSWTPVLGTALGGSDLTHTGTYRVFARVLSGIGGADLQARFTWDVGDLTNPTENRPWTFPTPAQGFFYVADLGEVRIDAPDAGDHKWVGQVEARAVNDGAASFGISDLWFQPVDDGCGVLRAAPSASATFTSFTARDNFDSAGSNTLLTGRTMQVGGSWAGAGDATDFRKVSAAGPGSVYRQEVGDAAPFWGRYAVAGNNPLAGSSARVTFLHQNPLSGCGSGVFLRYTDMSNWLLAVIWAWPGPLTNIEVWKYTTAGGQVKLGSYDAPWAISTNYFYTLELRVDPEGSFGVWFNGANQPIWGPWVSGNDSALAPGGALATGRQGFYDNNSFATATIRLYDDFSVSVPAFDAVLFANQSAELTHSGIYRQAITGNSYGPVSHVTGDLPRLPPSGLESRPCEVFLKGTRGDLDQLPDSYANNLIADNLEARLFYRPSWLFVPEAGTGTVQPHGLFPSPTLFPDGDPELLPEFF